VSLLILKQSLWSDIPYALDGEVGIGFGLSSAGSEISPLLDDLDLFKAPVNKEILPGWWEDFILEKYIETASTNLSKLVLNDEDLQNIRHQSLKLENKTASCFYVFGNIFAPTQRSVRILYFLNN
jgi:hypothetical protein